MKKSLLFILGLFLIGIVSCDYGVIEPKVFEVPPGVSFTADIEPFLVENCASCHSSRKPVIKTGSTYNSLIEGAFVNTSDPESSSLYIKVTEGQHPAPNSLSGEELAYFLKWVEEGAQNN